MNTISTAEPLIVAITGGADGIGKEIARQFSESGAKVAIGDLDVHRAQRTACELQVRAYPLNVTSPESFRDFFQCVHNDLGPIDVLVSNAGLMHVGPFEYESEKATRAQVEVNLLGVIHGIKTIVPSMLARGSGHLITLASAASTLAPPGEATYTATKHGVLGYLKAVRAELAGTGINVTAVMPGVVDTTLARGTVSGAAPLLMPNEVARVVVQAVARPRFEITLPRYIGPLTRLVNILPTILRDKVFSWLVPNQLKDASKPARADYEADFTE